MTKFSRDDVTHLADLARISLEENSIDEFHKQLSKILDYVGQLNQVDTTGIKPTSQVTGLTNIARADDDFSDTMTNTELLDQTPEVVKGQIKVPKVL